MMEQITVDKKMHPAVL